jgi:hypothetical protein
MTRILLSLMLTLWPHEVVSEPGPLPARISEAGFQLILLARPHGRIIPSGRPFWKIIRDPLGN